MITNDSVTIHVRLPGYQAAVEIMIGGTSTPVDAMRIIMRDYHVAKLEQHQLVISPSTSKSGGILDQNTAFHKFKLDPSDVLEVWKAPFVISVALQTASGRPADAKRLAFDCDTPLTNLIPIVQNCFPAVGNDEFSFQQCLVTADGSISQASALWLNANESLLQQRFGGEYTLLIVPMTILARMPARLLSQKATREGWLYKESHKNDKLTPRKRRYCIVRSAFLFYFKHQNDHHPAGVVPLQYYTARKVTREPRGTVIVLRRAFQSFENGGADAFLFHIFDKSDSIVDWFEAIRKRCVNVSDKLFGVPIERVALATAGDDNVPHFVRQCCDYILQPQIVVTEGLFRVSGSAAAIAALKDQFDQAQDVVLIGNNDVDPHTVTTLFKTFFRELPVPLFPFDYYDLMVASHQSTKTKEKQIYEMLHTTSQLPRANYDVLRFLCRFLHQVAAHSDRNKMSRENLGRVWASNLLRRRDDEPNQDVADINVLNDVVADLIDKHDRFFHIDDNATRGYRNRAPTVDNIIRLAPSALAGDDDEDTLDEKRSAGPAARPQSGAIDRNVAAVATMRPSQQTLQRSLSPRSLAAGDLATSVPIVANDGEPLKTGYLTKQGGQRKNWKSRWFVLSNVQLDYYVDNKPKSALKGVIVLRNAAVRVATELKRSHTIAVVTSDRVYYISAESEPSCTAWLNAITGVINRLKAPLLGGSPAPQQQQQQQQSVWQPQQQPTAAPTRPPGPPPSTPADQLSPAPGLGGAPPPNRTAPKSPPPVARRQMAPPAGRADLPAERASSPIHDPDRKPISPRAQSGQFRPQSQQQAPTGALARVPSKPHAGAAPASAESAATIKELTARVAALEKELREERALRADVEKRLAKYEQAPDTPSVRAIDAELSRVTREQADIEAQLDDLDEFVGSVNKRFDATF
jgi:hypothetical protein